MYGVKLLVGGRELEITDKTRQNHFQLRHHEDLCNAVSRTNLKRPVSAFCRIQLVFGSDKPPFWDKVVGPIPIDGRALQLRVYCKDGGNLLSRAFLAGI